MKVPKNLSRLEQETLIRTSAADREWDFYTRDPKFLRKMKKRGWPIAEDHPRLMVLQNPPVRRQYPRLLFGASAETRRSPSRTVQETPGFARFPGTP